MYLHLDQHEAKHYSKSSLNFPDNLNFGLSLLGQATNLLAPVRITAYKCISATFERSLDMQVLKFSQRWL
jgi:fumarylacetoacetate (FAA) hydrolase family protein